MIATRYSVRGIKETPLVPATMRAAALDRSGAPDVLKLHELPVPDVGPSEVLIAIHTAGVGGWDADMREGWYVLVQLRHPKGGIYAEYVAVDAENVGRLLDAVRRGRLACTFSARSFCECRARKCPPGCASACSPGDSRLSRNPKTGSQLLASPLLARQATFPRSLPCRYFHS